MSVHPIANTILADNESLEANATRSPSLLDSSQSLETNTVEPYTLLAYVEANTTRDIILLADAEDIY